MGRAHMQNVVRACERIERTPWGTAEKERAMRDTMEQAAAEWLHRGWVTVQHFLADNTNSMQDIPKIEATVNEKQQREDFKVMMGRKAI